MDEVRLACPSSDGCAAQEVKTQMDVPPDLCNQIRELLCTTLSDYSIKVMQEKLLLMQRSSYYLTIQQDDLTKNAGRQQNASHLSDSRMWSLIDQRRLQSATALGKSQVRLLLTLLGMLCQEIIRGCQELVVFVVKYNLGSVDSDMAASAQKKLQQISQYVNNFERNMNWSLRPLNLQNPLIRNTGNNPVPRLSASLAYILPVIFNRFGLRVTPSSVYLCWRVAGEESMDQQFEIHTKSLHLSTDEHSQSTQVSCQSYNIHINNLIPDRYYQFSVKRVDTVNLVYGEWIDTIILKTLNISK